MNDILEIKNLDVCFPSKFGKTYAVQDVEIRLERGEILGVVGESGAGKSTVGNAIINLLEPPGRITRGKIIFDGKNIKNLNDSEMQSIRGKRIGMIFQDHRLLMDKTVFDNVALPLIIEGYSVQEARKRVLAALEKVGLADKVKHYPQMLSGGEQQRVGIARAIVTKPPLLLADEPTGNLDPKLSMEIIRLFEEFNKVGVAVLIATHDLGLIARLRYRTLTLKDGRMINDGLEDNEL